MRFFLFLLLASCLVLFSCSPTRGLGRHLKREVRHSAVFDQAFTGFVLMDPTTGRVLSQVNGHRRFTPASTTKIFTLYTALHLLGDSVPVFRYQQRDNALWIVGMGDPTLLHPEFSAWSRGVDFLKNAPRIFWSPVAEEPSRYGPGWAWDDQHDDYQAEMSDLPLYGNLRRVYAPTDTTLSVTPSFYQKMLRAGPSGLPPGRLVFEEDTVLFSPKSRWPKGFEQWVPMLHMRRNLPVLLADTLHRPVTRWPLSADALPDVAFKTLYATPLDTVLRRMMHHSDNFLADQLLVVCGAQRLHLMRQDSVIAFMLRGALKDLPQRPRWVDGSGLSRYNLFSPLDVAHVLRLLWLEHPKDRLFSLFPAGGVSGTVADWYAGPHGQPYVFAKTGTLAGVHCLSGYVVREHGPTLIFSFMHNGYVGSNRQWKSEMERLLKVIAGQAPSKMPGATSR